MYIFNPDNDLALANFSPHFTAPASALKMRSDLAMLPIWYAPDKAVIIVQNGLNIAFLDALKTLLQIGNKLISMDEAAHYSPRKVVPWGWNPALRKELIHSGFDEKLLPTMADIALLRDYSSRQNAVKLLKELKAEDASFCGSSYYCRSVDELLAYLSKVGGNQVLKMPYSGSGKGLVWLKCAITDKQTDWCRRVVKMQGGVVVEPVLDKVQDFAMEFEMAEAGIQFVGYSLFKSASSGAYLGNVLLSDAEIEEELSNYVGRNVLLSLKAILKKKLNSYFPHYRGFLGVDMMVCKTDQSVYQLHPCVEVNMRMNMGIVAHRIREQFVCPSATGLFSINYFKQENHAYKHSMAMQSDNPLVIENGKIRSGYLALTPIDKDTRYTATIVIKEKSRRE